MYSSSSPNSLTVFGVTITHCSFQTSALIFSASHSSYPIWASSHLLCMTMQFAVKKKKKIHIREEIPFTPFPQHIKHPIHMPHQKDNFWCTAFVCVCILACVCLCVCACTSCSWPRTIKWVKTHNNKSYLSA